jgi:plastocyanin
MTKLLAIATAFAVISACGGTDEARVEMVSAQRFDPHELQVAPGDPITFDNVSSEAHTVTAYSEELPDGTDYFSSGGFDSEEEARDDLAEALIPAGESFELVLEQPGRYRYFCIPHEGAGMRGWIVVE